MSEYFDISLIGEKSSVSRMKTNACLSKLGLSEGENNTYLFGYRKILICFIDDDEADFEEISIGIPELCFHKENFDDELKVITNFINQFFESNDCLKYALCSYELNGYLLSGMKELQEFNNDILSKFPIVYERRDSYVLPSLLINIESQDIFV